jgi:ClpP class serine protease
MSRLLHDIVGGVWSIREDYALNLMPHIEKLIAGQNVDMNAQANNARAEAISDQKSNMVVAVIPFQNVITKYNYCGMAGLLSIERQLKQLDADSNVDAIIFDMDTPGGEASYLPNFAKTLDSIQKPIVTYFSGMCCSAGMYIASRTNAIFASTATDEVGSIGTMLSFRAPNPDKKDADTVLHTIYATASTDKNGDFREALKGNYELIRKKRLDPLNETFLSNVRSGRPGVSEDVLTGNVYNASTAAELKLIDGIKTFDEAIAYAIQIAANQQQANQLKTDMKKSFIDKASSILGRNVEATEDLTAEEWVTISERISENAPEAGSENPAVNASVDTEAIVSQITENLSGTIQGSVNSALEPINAEMNARLSAIESRLSSIEKVTPAAPAADVGAVAGADSTELDPWLDPNNPLNKQIEEDLA